MPGTSSEISGAPDARPAAAVVTAGNGVYIVHRHQLGGIERLGAGSGDDQRHRLADITDLALGQQGLRREGERLAGLRIGSGGGQQWFEPVRADIIGGQHREHTRCLARPLSSDAFDQCMRMRRAQHDRMRQAFEDQVIEIMSAPGNKTQILAPLGSVADHRAGRHVRIRLSRQLVSDGTLDFENPLNRRARHHALVMGR